MTQGRDQATPALGAGSIKLADAVGKENEGTVEGEIANWYQGLGPSEQGALAGVGDRFPTRDGNPTIHYKLDKALANPWNGLIGMDADIDRRFQIRTELGFFGRTQMLVGVNYRFGFIKE